MALPEEMGYNTEGTPYESNKYGVIQDFKVLSDQKDIKSLKSLYDQFSDPKNNLNDAQLTELNDIFNKAKTKAINELSDDVLEKLGIDPNNPDSNSTIPLIDSKYLTHKVAGNILDSYDVPQYKLRLFMRTAESLARDQSPTENSSTAKEDRQDQASSTSKSSGVKQPNPEDIVILAETGSTDIGIDNLTIAHLTNNDDNIPTTFNFTLTEPGSVTLLDRIAAAKEHCGFPQTNDVPYFLELEFKGYTTDMGDEDQGGLSKTIAGPFIYQIAGVTFSMDITTQGAVYEFTAYENSDIAKFDKYYTIKESITISGNNIREIVADLETKWNEKLKGEVSGTSGKPDKVVINLDKLVQPVQDKETDSEGTEANTSVTASNLISNEFFKDKFNAEDFAKRGFEIKTSADAANEGAVPDDTNSNVTRARDNSGNTLDVNTSDPEDIDSPDVATENKKAIPQTDLITIKLVDGSKFSDAMNLILSLSEDLFQRATRLSDSNDIKSQVNKNQAYIDWFNIDTDLVRDYKNYDEYRREYAKTIIFTPKLIQESRTDIAVSEDELNVNLSVDEVKNRLNQLKLFKEYYYMFSGKNDQIIDFNLRFNEAFALSHPAFGKGDFAQQSQMAIAPALQEKEAVNNKISNTGAGSKAEKQVKPGNILSILKDLKAKGEEAFTNLTNQFGDYLGFTDQELKEITNDLDGEKARLLAESLADERISDALVNNELVKKVRSPQTGSPTESDETADTENNTAPGYIDFLYASELIKGLEGDGLSESDAKTIVKAKVRNPKPKLEKTDAKNNVAEAPGERDSYRPSAFSHLMERHSEASSNQIINLTLRGDPWYLGSNNFYDSTSKKDSTEKTNQDSSKLTQTSLNAAQWSGGSVDFLIVLESPRKFDFNIDDEDQNTGLFDFSGINYTMSGVYHIIKAVTNFSNGLFTVEVTATKDNDYDMSLIELAKSVATATVNNEIATAPALVDKSQSIKADPPVNSEPYTAPDGTIFGGDGEIVYSRPFGAG